MSGIVDQWPLIAFVILILLGVLAVRYSSISDNFPYENRGQVLTDSEKRFHQVLVTAAGDDWIVLAKVRIADLLCVSKDVQQRLSWQNRINSKHVDFVLCDPESLETITAIELDDRSQRRPERMARDRFVDTAFASAGVSLIRFPILAQYDSEKIRARIDAVPKNSPAVGKVA